MPAALEGLRRDGAALRGGLAGERATLRDLGRKNGTLCGQQRVTGEVELADGDEIRIGPARLVFCAAGAGSTRSRP